MKVSVIIPCFNEENYLGQCLESLCQQSLPADEIIICDNSSTDNSLAIAQAFRLKLPLKIIHQPIKGLLPTVEKAWRATTGDLVIRTDADAVFPRDWLNNLVRHFDDSNLAACGGNWIPYPKNIFWQLVMALGFKVGDLVLPLVQGHNLLYGPNTAIRRSVMVHINGYLTTDQHAVDDQLISSKLTQSKLKYARFPDCWNYHSARRLHQSPHKLFLYTLSNIFPRLYQEKVI